MAQRNKWYGSGLRFACTECGQCCTGSPGYVWISMEEMEQMAAYLDLSLDRFVQRYTRRVGNRYSLKETGPHFDCTFLEKKRCRIYQVRPSQCRNYPFWPKNLRSKESWEAAARDCEGISNEAPLISSNDIERILDEGRD